MIDVVGNKEGMDVGVDDGFDDGCNEWMMSHRDQ